MYAVGISVHADLYEIHYHFRLVCTGTWFNCERYVESKSLRLPTNAFGGESERLLSGLSAQAPDLIVKDMPRMRVCIYTQMHFRDRMKVRSQACAHRHMIQHKNTEN